MRIQTIREISKHICHKQNAVRQSFFKPQNRPTEIPQKQYNIAYRKAPKHTINIYKRRKTDDTYISTEIYERNRHYTIQPKWSAIHTKKFQKQTDESLYCKKHAESMEITKR